ncbi:hypothetical protein DFH08DRAFT_827599 [Mycena albidolilacea]|uniref:Uncharacterized protein n=1 Tax=Mycena albidolilacea TaxID=1033008 RepID=A0AAD7E806_9AGAR|nr:hypothetical protein DFH08DRAFT_827599 [Mycena albidolilacea]
MAKNGQKQQKEAFSWFKLGTDLYYQGLQSGLLIFPPKKLSAIFDSITMLEIQPVLSVLFHIIAISGTADAIRGNSPSTTCQVSISSLGPFCRGSFPMARAIGIKLLTDLKAAIDNIPDGIAAGRCDGLLAKNLTPKYTDDTPPIAIFPSDGKDGNYAAFSNQWERVFQLKSSTDLPESKYPLVEALLRLIPAASAESSEDEYPASVPIPKPAKKTTAPKSKSKATNDAKPKSAKIAKPKSASDVNTTISLVSEDEAGSYSKKRKSPMPTSDGNESETQVAPPKPKKSKPSAPPASEDDSGDDAPARHGAKLRWANKKDELIWNFKCR